MDLFSDLPEPSTKIPAHSKSDECLHEQKRKYNDNGEGENTKDCDQEEKKMKHNIEENKSDKIATPVPRYNFTPCFASRKGEREEMQDAHTIISDFLTFVTSQRQGIEISSEIKVMSYYAVFDGHGGARASQYAAKHLHVNLASLLPTNSLAKLEAEIKKCLVEAFKRTDEDFLKAAAASKPSWKDGTTAIMVLRINNILYIANLGDSKAIMCRYVKDTDSYCGIPLSQDHSPTMYEERQRIQKSGGYVKEGRVLGILEVSRSLGDGQYKKHGVICVPDVKRCQVTGDDRYILIACDGLWKSFSTDSAIQFINSMTREGGKEKYDEACTKVCTAAVKKCSGDNVTVIIVAIS